jgi:hypothetical protein
VSDFAIFDREYARLLAGLAAYDWLRPLNLLQEEQNFLAALHRGERYNPLFSYAPPGGLAGQCEDLLRALPPEPSAVSGWYKELLEEERAKALMTADRESEAFAPWLGGLYPAPDQGLLAASRDILAGTAAPAAEERPELDAEELCREFQSCLDALDLGGWKAEIAPIPARVNVRILAPSWGALCAFTACALYFNGVVQQRHAQLVESAPHGLVQYRIRQFFSLLTFQTHEQKRPMFVMAAGAGHIGIQGVDAVRQPVVQQEIQNPVNRGRGQAFTFIAHLFDKIIGFHWAFRQQQNFQNRAA